MKPLYNFSFLLTILLLTSFKFFSQTSNEKQIEERIKFNTLHNFNGQVEKYCRIDELIANNQSNLDELRLKFDLNKSNNLSLIHGIGISFIISASENINEFSSNELVEVFNLSNDENIELLVNHLELRINFNTCIRIEYVKDRLKSIGVEINELNGTIINIAN